MNEENLEATQVELFSVETIKGAAIYNLFNSGSVTSLQDSVNAIRAHEPFSKDYQLVILTEPHDEFDEVTLKSLLELSFEVAIVKAKDGRRILVTGRDSDTGLIGNEQNICNYILGVEPTEILTFAHSHEKMRDKDGKIVNYTLKNGLGLIDVPSREDMGICDRNPYKWIIIAPNSIFRYCEPLGDIRDELLKAFSEYGIDAYEMRDKHRWPFDEYPQDEKIPIVQGVFSRFVTERYRWEDQSDEGTSGRLNLIRYLNYSPEELLTIESEKLKLHPYPKAQKLSLNDLNEKKQEKSKPVFSNGENPFRRRPMGGR